MGGGVKLQLVYKEDSCFLTNVYRKPTFTGLYIHWDSFFPKKRKLNLIKTLVHRALIICSESKLDGEVGFITETLCNNGFPEDIVRSVIRDEIAHFHKIKVTSAQICPVSLRLPWLGEISDQFANQISASIRRCYFASNLRVVFRTHTVLPYNDNLTFPPGHIYIYMYIFFPYIIESISPIFLNLCPSSTMNR